MKNAPLTALRELSLTVKNITTAPNTHNNKIKNQQSKLTSTKNLSIRLSILNMRELNKYGLDTTSLQLQHTRLTPFSRNQSNGSITICPIEISYSDMLDIDNLFNIINPLPLHTE